VLLGIRSTTYAKVDRYYMNLQTPLGEYARDQALLLLPEEHPIVQEVKATWGASIASAHSLEGNKAANGSP
jgi:hypothetical protein